MKKLPCTAAVLVMLFCHGAFASSGTINFRGAIVNAPCSIPASTWLHYAQQPAAYRQARQARPTPSCADATATQSVQISRHIAQTMSSPDMPGTPSKTVVTVVYN